MTKTHLYNALTTILLIMVIIQAPLIYYYTFGLFAFFVVIPYLFVGLGLTLGLLIAVMRNKNGKRTNFQKIGLMLTVVIGTLSLFFGEDFIEQCDWQFRKATRQEIVDLVKADKLKPNVSYNGIICTLHKWNIPPISNGGNEIAISKPDTDKVTVEFYINRGFLDHYSAFVYTNDPEEMKELNERISQPTESLTNKKLDENWYRVSY